MFIAYIRVGGNRKGVFTRDRQPKMAAYHVRKRYYFLQKELDGTEIPTDLEDYISLHYSFHSRL